MTMSPGRQHFCLLLTVLIFLWGRGGGMLRLQNCLSGKALTMVKDIGHSLNAYERAKAKLEK